MDSSQEAAGMAELVGLVTRNVLQQLQTSHGAPMPEPGSPDGLGSLGLYANFSARRR